MDQMTMMMLASAARGQQAPMYTPYAGSLYGQPGSGYGVNPYGASASQFFPGTTPPSVGSLNIPGLSPGMSAVVGSMLPTVLNEFMPNQMFGQLVFSSGVNYNPYQNWRALQNQAQYKAALESGVQADQARIANMALGLERMLDLQLSDSDRDSWVSGLQGVVTSFAPTLLGSNPRLAEALGLGGLASSSQMFLAGQYSLDPSTGRFGATADTTSALTRAVAEAYVQDPIAFRGVTQSRLSEFYANTARIGGAGGSVRWAIEAGGPELMQQLIEEGRGLSDAQLSALGLSQREGTTINQAIEGGASSGDRRAAFTQAIGSLDQAKTVRWFEENVEVVRALQDVFGPDGTAAELMDQLNQLTQMNAGRLSPEEQARLLREFNALGEITGATMESIAMATGMAADFVVQAGGDRRAATSVSQEALTRKAAYGQFNLQQYGVDLEKWMAEDLQRGASASASPAANQIGLLRRLLASGSVGEGSEAARLREALDRGELTYVDDSGQTRSIYHDNDGAFLDMLARSGADPALTAAMMYQTEANIKAASGDVGAIMDLQLPTDAERDLRQRILNHADLTMGLSPESSDAMARDVTEAFRGLAPAAWFENDGQAVTDALRSALSPYVPEGQLGQTTQYFRDMAVEEMDLRDLYVKQFISRSLSPEIRAGISARADMDEIFSGLSSPSMSQNFIQYLTDVAEGRVETTSLLDAVGATVGGIPKEVLAEKAGPGFAEAEAVFAREMESLRGTATDGRPVDYERLKSSLLVMQEYLPMLGGDAGLADETQAIRNTLGLTTSLDLSKWMTAEGTSTLSDRQRSTLTDQIQSAISQLPADSQSAAHLRSLLGGDVGSASDQQLVDAARAVVVMNMGIPQASALGTEKASADDKLAEDLQTLTEIASGSPKTKVGKESRRAPVEAPKPEASAPPRPEDQAPGQEGDAQARARMPEHMLLTGNITIDGKPARLDGALINPAQGSVS